MRMIAFTMSGTSSARPATRQLEHQATCWWMQAQEGTALRTGAVDRAERLTRGETTVLRIRERDALGVSSRHRHRGRK